MVKTHGFPVSIFPTKPIQSNISGNSFDFPMISHHFPLFSYDFPSFSHHFPSFSNDLPLVDGAIAAARRRLSGARLQNAPRRRTQDATQSSDGTARRSEPVFC